MSPWPRGSSWRALRQAAKLLDNVAEWNRLYGVQINREELGRISALLSEPFGL